MSLHCRIRFVVTLHTNAYVNQPTEVIITTYLLRSNYISGYTYKLKNTYIHPQSKRIHMHHRFQNISAMEYYQRQQRPPSTSQRATAHRYRWLPLQTAGGPGFDSRMFVCGMCARAPLLPLRSLRAWQKKRSSLFNDESSYPEIPEYLDKISLIWLFTTKY